jgi:tetratricopeptide (TPR) repeat protein
MHDSGSGEEQCPRTVRVMLRAARQLQNASLLTQARQTFQAAAQRDPSHTARVEFGRFLAQIDCHEDAAAQFLILLNTACDEGNHRLKAVACNNLAAVLRESGEWTQAARLQQRSLQAESEIRGREQAGSQVLCDLTNLANDAILSQQLELAKSLLLRSLRSERLRESGSGEADDWGSLGVVWLLMHRTQPAFSCLWKAYRIHRRGGDARGCGTDLMNLAQVCHDCNRPAAAARMLSRAVRCFERAHADLMAARARRLFAEASQMTAVHNRKAELN